MINVYKKDVTKIENIIYLLENILGLIYMGIFSEEGNTPILQLVLDLISNVNCDSHEYKLLQLFALFETIKKTMSYGISSDVASRIALDLYTRCKLSDDTLDTLMEIISE